MNSIRDAAGFGILQRDKACRQTLGLERFGGQSSVQERGLAEWAEAVCVFEGSHGQATSSFDLHARTTLAVKGAFCSRYPALIDYCSDLFLARAAEVCQTTLSRSPSRRHQASQPIGTLVRASSRQYSLAERLCRPTLMEQVAEVSLQVRE